MSRSHPTVALLLVAVIAGTAGFLFNLVGPKLPTIEPATKILESASIVDLNGKPQTLSQWRGKVLLVNFWATWCLPCREEIPALIRTQRKYAAKGVQFAGIGIDSAAKIIDFASEMNIDYVLLIGGMEALDMTKELGNRYGVLPFTVVLDRSGKMVFAHAGALTEAILDGVLAPLI